MPGFSIAQDKCGIIKYQQLLEQKNIIKENTGQFEHWLAEKILLKKNEPKESRSKEIIVIPVVVHIIHNGEPVGVGGNISDDQIISQIEVLNEDFRRLNADASNTPAVFQPVASDIEIEFVMAKRDPEGLPTSGINRVNGGRSTWFLVDNYELKTLSNWPSEDYMNIWVASLGDGFLGYAQFPISDIGGLETASNSAITDGIVVDVFAFGSESKYPPANLDSRYNLGRTTTHEVGHYLGLRHIWGDGGCGVDDFCADTPASSAANEGGLDNCTFPGPSRCGSDDMFQNYMDFSNDACMNLFTEDQKTRIRTVMDNSPRRASLKTSQGAQEPVVVSDDLGIRSILSPTVNSCDENIIPELELRNYGDNTITSAVIETILNGVSQGTTSATLGLEPLEIGSLELPDVALNPSIINNLGFVITEVNGGTDGNTGNDALNINVTVPEEQLGPINENFDELPSNWTIENDDELITWELRSAPSAEPGNQALFIRLYDHENQGDVDLFTSPVLDFSAAVSTLSFDVAYAQFPGVDTESLRVIVTENCVDPLSMGDVVFEEIGADLSTASSTTAFFIPGDVNDWETKVIDLSGYLGRDNMRISFVSRNDFGNNLYIDNITLLTIPVPGIDLTAINSPSPVSNNTSPQLQAEIRNSGAVPLETFNVQYTIDGGLPVITSVATEVPVGESFTFNDELDELSEGTHRLDFAVDNPNGEEDFNPSNNSTTLFFEVNTNDDLAPFKETFTDASLWVVGNEDNDVTWIIQDGVASIALDIYEAIGEQDWLVSPTINLSESSQATLNFDYSYSHSSVKNDGLRVLISRDGGNTYEPTSFNNQGLDLKSGVFLNNRSQTEFENISISLANYLGETEVRIAFVSTNDNGDPIFVDNIQLFTTDLFLSAENTIFPNPTVNGQFNVQFKLDERENVNVMLIDGFGHQVFEQSLPNTVNQTYTFDIGNRAQGIYFLRVNGESFSYVRRILKSN